MKSLRLDRAGLAGAAVLLAILTSLAATTPAAAQPQVSGGVGVLSFQYTCLGYTGTFKDGSSIIRAGKFYELTEECFGIAPNRTIWHAWPNSGGWREMPGNGRADNMAAVVDSIDYGRTVFVDVVGSSTRWCNTNPRGSVGWDAWVRC